MPDAIPSTLAEPAAPSSPRRRWWRWLTALRPAQQAVDARERLRAVVGALLGIALTALLSRFLSLHDAAGVGAVWLVAPLGASAVLVFAVPASPLAQPWAVVGGNVFSAAVGILCARLVGDTGVAAGLAVSLAIGVMFWLRCLHPPGGAMALLTVLTHTTSWSFLAFPALTNCLLLVAAGMAYNTATGRPYPHAQRPVQPPATGLQRFSSQDLDQVLARYNQVLDISRDDLEALLQETEMQAYRRQLGTLRCGDIMSTQLIVVEFGDALEDAWALMRRHSIKALPVVDRLHRIVGIVTLADFIRHAQLEGTGRLGERFKAFIRRTTSVYSDKPEVVGQIMTRQVRVASVDRHVVDLMPLFSEAGHHHIPIVADNNRLVGIITQSDFVRALYRTAAPGMA